MYLPGVLVCNLQKPSWGSWAVEAASGNDDNDGDDEIVNNGLGECMNCRRLILEGNEGNGDEDGGRKMEDGGWRKGKETKGEQQDEKRKEGEEEKYKVGR